MLFRQVGLQAGLALILATAWQVALARDLRVTIPGRSILTPVQRLNRDGVEAVVKHQYEKAEGLFYKAYLYDPADPFTLNNLGYVSELHGQLDRAETFYKLALKQGSSALVDRSDAKQLAGKPMMYALGTLKNTPMRVNRINVMGIEMLSAEHPLEAETLLTEALSIDPHNAFTLNNLGVAAEARGDFETALRFYDEAAATRSQDLVVVTPKRSWRGKPVSEMAQDSSKSLGDRMRTMDPAVVRANMLAIRGVSALNRNDWPAAKKDFLEAFPLSPHNAFALNNRGYVAERDGDPEAAKFFYSAAQRAPEADGRVGAATHAEANGMRLSTVAGESTQKIDDQLAAFSESRRQQKGPVELRRRNPPAGAPQTVPLPPTVQRAPDANTSPTAPLVQVPE